MTNLKNILSRASETITTQRAGRLEKVGLRASKDYKEACEKEVEAIQEQLEDLLDLSAGVDINAGQSKISNKDMEEKIQKLHKLEEELYLKKQRLEIATRVYQDLASEGESNS